MGLSNNWEQCSWNGHCGLPFHPPPFLHETKGCIISGGYINSTQSTIFILYLTQSGEHLHFEFQRIYSAFLSQGEMKTSIYSDAFIEGCTVQLFFQSLVLRDCIGLQHIICHHYIVKYRLQLLVSEKKNNKVLLKASPHFLDENSDKIWVLQNEWLHTDKNLQLVYLLLKFNTTMHCKKNYLTYFMVSGIYSYSMTYSMSKHCRLWDVRGFFLWFTALLLSIKKSWKFLLVCSHQFFNIYD